MTIAERALAYCASPFERRRRQTRVVMVGDVGVGGDHPVRVQSMTTTRTLDTDATVAQAIRLVDAGCEIVRITAPTVADAKNLGAIRQRLRGRGIGTPLVADIHFSPAAAFEAALHVEKVRINPGNFADSKAFAVREYTDEQYAAELARIEERFKPIVLRCKERSVALRVGTNHGSLSDRIMNRFGDTPLGMVESALEFVAICEKYDFHDVIFSMKASNPKVMIQAYRLLAARLDALYTQYPFHLGVTDAGNGEDGRIKSALGIGSLLEDGIGDTIRVSLTEEPEAEIPVAFAIADRYTPRHLAVPGAPALEVRASDLAETPPYDAFVYTRRATEPVAMNGERVGGEGSPRVITSIPGPLASDPSSPIVARRLLVPVSRKHPKPDLLGVYVVDRADARALMALRGDLDRGGFDTPILARVWPGDPCSLGALLVAVAPNAAIVGVRAADITAESVAALASVSPLRPCLVEGELTADDEAEIETLIKGLGDVLARGISVVAGLSADSPERLIHGARRLVAGLGATAVGQMQRVPLLLVASRTRSGSDQLLDAAIGLGAPLCDGIGDAVEVLTPGDPATAMRLAFDVLQAAGARISKTDYVACPSCGRTLFDLQSTTETIKTRTDHLTGVKIAIMGCVVNGPGEMADADFGYVGGAPGQVNLYVGKQCVERGIPEGEAADRLIALIRARGRWIEPD